jgi:kynurenine--oxoglutarate transaminase/cysteine-S-conjugate beta-lyase/glutamine--phenylpyruvate transaminase
VVNLGQGFPDCAPPPFVREAALEAISLDCHQYTRPAGHPPLVKLLASRYSAHLERKIDPMAEVAVTVGCSQALFISMQCLVKPGDEVLLLEPFFDLYVGQIRMAGGIPRYVPLTASPEGWSLDMDALEATLTDRTRVLILNSPHNPTGKVFGRGDLNRLADLVRRWPLVTVVSDEVYKYTVHGEGHEHVHFASLPGMFDRTLTLSSAGKTFSVTGWQIGWIVGPAKLVRDVHIALPFLQFCASTPMQQALVGVLTQADFPYGGSANYYEWLNAQYRRKAALLSAALDSAKLPVVASQGGYFLTCDVSKVEVPQEYLGEVSAAMGPVSKDWAFCKWLAIEHGVLSIPVAPFFSKESRSRGDAGAYVRFAFCKNDSTIERAALRLKKFGERAQ